MTRSVSALVAPVAVLLFAATPARPASSWGSLGTWSDVCALATVDRQTATTRTCLVCHDGVVAPARTLAPSPGSHDAHPIDVDYDAATQRNPRLSRRFDISRAFALPGGQVTCVTCHDGASKEPMHTALTMARSRMCTSCHAL